jgi:predicted small secreted protein
MYENIVLIIIAAVAGVVLVGVAVYYVMRFMRGSIKLTLQKTAFNAGETIRGSFQLITKKDIQSNKLVVSLIGKQVIKTNRGDKTETEHREIYRNEVMIEDSRLYRAGHNAKHDFELPVPDPKSQELMNNPMIQKMALALRILGSTRSHMKWSVEARLDARGIDLVTSQPVSINIDFL